MSDLQSGGNSANNPAAKKKKLIIIIALCTAAVLLVAAMLTVYFTVINPSAPGVKNVKIEVVVPGDKIYNFKNKSDEFDEGKSGATLLDYLNYLKDKEGLEADISASGFINGFYGYKPDINTEFWKIYVDGKASGKGAKALKLADGAKYAFITEKADKKDYAKNAYPDFIADSAYWDMPAVGKKDLTVKVLFIGSEKTLSITSEKTNIEEVLGELQAAGKAAFGINPDFGFGTSIDTVDSVKYDDPAATYFWQVFVSFSDKWSDDFIGHSEINNLRGAATDWLSGEATIPGTALFDNMYIYIKAIPSGF